MTHEFTFDHIDREIQALDAFAEPHALMAAPLQERLARLGSIYRGLRPFVVMLASSALFPAAWRAALTLFMTAVESVVPPVPASFKAGRDLEE